MDWPGAQSSLATHRHTTPNTPASLHAHACRSASLQACMPAYGWVFSYAANTADIPLKTKQCLQLCKPASLHASMPASLQASKPASLHACKPVCMRADNPPHRKDHTGALLSALRLPCSPQQQRVQAALPPCTCNFAGGTAWDLGMHAAGPGCSSHGCERLVQMQPGQAAGCNMCMHWGLASHPMAACGSSRYIQGRWQDAADASPARLLVADRQLGSSCRMAWARVATSPCRPHMQQQVVQAGSRQVGVDLRSGDPPMVASSTHVCRSQSHNQLEGITGAAHSPHRSRIAARWQVDSRQTGAKQQADSRQIAGR